MSMLGSLAEGAGRENGIEGRCRSKWRARAKAKARDCVCRVLHFWSRRKIMGSSLVLCVSILLLHSVVLLQCQKLSHLIPSHPFFFLKFVAKTLSTTCTWVAAVEEHLRFFLCIYDLRLFRLQFQFCFAGTVGDGSVFVVWIVPDGASDFNHVCGSMSR